MSEAPTELQHALLAVVIACINAVSVIAAAKIGRANGRREANGEGNGSRKVDT